MIMTNWDQKTATNTGNYFQYRKLFGFKNL